MVIGVWVDVDHFADHGWVLVEDLVPTHRLDAVVELVCGFLGVSPERSSSSDKRGDRINGIVPLHQHQALWDNRQAALMHEAFTAIYRQRELWVTMDRVSYKPRLSERAKFAPGDANAIHVDRKLSETSFGVQGVLYLTDTPEDQGAWECVPGMFDEIREGTRTSVQWAENVDRYEVERVAGKAGSLVIWDSRMPHGSGHNWTDVPRFTQYITMNPPGDESTRRERVADWRTCRAPAHWRGLPHQPDPEPWPAPAVLTMLGERVLGARPWSD